MNPGSFIFKVDVKLGPLLFVLFSKSRVPPLPPPPFKLSKTIKASELCFLLVVLEPQALIPIKYQ